MTLYTLQKAIREINRDPLVREQFMASPDSIATRFQLTELERNALIARDYGTLYRMGVHGLLLRPFSLLHQQPEPDYLRAIRGEA